jgi:hypothetical protein
MGKHLAHRPALTVHNWLKEKIRYPLPIVAAVHGVREV